MVRPIRSPGLASFDPANLSAMPPAVSVALQLAALVASPDKDLSARAFVALHRHLEWAPRSVLRELVAVLQPVVPDLKQ